MPSNETLIAFLQHHDVRFWLQHHSRAVTSEDLAASEHVSAQLVAKVVLVFADADMIMLVLPATRRIDTDKVARSTGARHVWLASEHDLARVFPDCAIGAMPPFGNLYDIPVYVDRTLADKQELIFPAGTHEDSIRMDVADYVRLVRPTVIDLAEESTPVVATV